MRTASRERLSIPLTCLSKVRAVSLLFVPPTFCRDSQPSELQWGLPRARLAQLRWLEGWAAHEEWCRASPEYCVAHSQSSHGGLLWPSRGLVGRTMLSFGFLSLSK